MTPQLHELEDAACNVIQIIKQIPDFEDSRLAVIGGLALWHYLHYYRPTNNINFITNIRTNPSVLKRKLLELPNSHFSQHHQILFYQNRHGRYFQVDIRPEWHFRYLPESAHYIHQIPYGEIPYISLADLIVFKLDSSSLRCDPKKRHQDAQDAATLIEHAMTQHSLSQYTASTTDNSKSLVTQTDVKPVVQLLPLQEQVVEEALCDVTRWGGRNKSWWEACLGLSRRSLTERPRNRPHAKSEPGPQWRPCGICDRVAGDPSAASYYERLDHPRARFRLKRWSSLGDESPECRFYPMSKSQTWPWNYWANLRAFWPKIAGAAAAVFPEGRSPTGNSNNTTGANLHSPPCHMQVKDSSHGIEGSDSGYGSFSDDYGGYLRYLGPAATGGEYHPFGVNGIFETKPCEPLGTVVEMTALSEQNEEAAHEGAGDQNKKSGKMWRTVSFQL